MLDRRIEFIGHVYDVTDFLDEHPGEQRPKLSIAVQADSSKAERRSSCKLASSRSIDVGLTVKEVRGYGCHRRI